MCPRATASTCCISPIRIRAARWAWAASASSSLGFESNALQAIDYRTGKHAWRHEWPHGRRHRHRAADHGHRAAVHRRWQRQFRGAGCGERRMLWHTRIGNISNAPQTFDIDGRQYVLVGVGDTLYSFVLYLMRIRYGMVGGGEGAFIGAVHRMAARLDDAVRTGVRCVQQRARRSRVARALRLGIAPQRCYDDYNSMMAREAALPADRAHAVRGDRHAQSHAPAHCTGRARARLSCAVRQARHGHTRRVPRRWPPSCAAVGLHYGLTHPYTGYPMIREARAAHRAR